MLSETKNTDLKRYAESEVVNKVQILADAESSCADCKKYDRTILSIEEAIQQNILPIRTCTHKYKCRCVYLPITISENIK